MDFQIHEARKTSIPWAQVCELIRADLLRQGAAEARQLWEEYRFGLFDGSNGFGDEFAVLAASVRWEEYLSLDSRRGQIFRTVQSLARIVQRAAHENIRFVSFGFDPTSESFPRVEIPPVIDTGSAVREVLRDMESALRDGRPLSGVDRAHTALHGHLEHVLSVARIPFAPDSQITFLFRELMQKHPAFSGSSTLGSHINNATSGLARVVDALGPARNRGSIAHPNDNLLDAPEAALFVDSANTLLGYIERRLAAVGKCSSR